MTAGPPSPIEGVFLTACRAADVPPGDAWLTSAEREVLAGLVVPKRVGDWRLGRWTAKAAAAAALAARGDPPVGPDAVEILARPGGRPDVRVLGSGTPGIALSLSHSKERGFAAALVARESSPDAEVETLGCDVEEVEPRSDGFLEDYLTEEERLLVAKGREGWEARANGVWSLKESALKALGRGLRVDTRTVRVTDLGQLDPDGSWAPCRVEGEGLGRPLAFWRVAEGFAWTLVCLSTAGEEGTEGS